MSISEQLEKEKKIKQETNRLKKLYKDFAKEKKKALEGIISEVAFMKTTLEELREYLLVNGLVEMFEQGEQRFKRERPESKMYTTYIQRYSNTMKQLIDLLPVEIKKEETDALMEFLKKGKVK